MKNSSTEEKEKDREKFRKVKFTLAKSKYVYMKLKMYVFFVLCSMYCERKFTSRFRSVKPTECGEMMMFKANIMECMKKMFGLVGTEAWGFDLIELKERTALLRVYRSYVSSTCFRLSIRQTTRTCTGT